MRQYHDFDFWNQIGAKSKSFGIHPILVSIIRIVDTNKSFQAIFSAFSTLFHRFSAGLELK